MADYNKGTNPDTHDSGSDNASILSNEQNSSNYDAEKNISNGDAGKNMLNHGSEKNVSKQQTPPGVKQEKRLCKKARICDPTSEANELATQKARLRARDSRDPLYSLRQQEYNRHLLAVENAKYIIDNSPPFVPKALYHGLNKTNRSTLLQAKIEVENANLLHSLAAIYNGATKTGLDSRLEPLSYTRIIRNRTYERAMKTVELMQQNIQTFQWLKKTKSVYSNEKLSKWYAQQQKHYERISKYPSVFKPRMCPLPFRKVMEKSLDNPRQFAYLLIEIEDVQAENLVVELYADLCPFTCKNFQTLCTNTKATSCDCRSYRCKKIDRLHCIQMIDGSFREIYWVIAEYVDSSIEYTQMMLQESSQISHTEAGLMTRPKNRSGGVFFITIGPCPHLDEYCYVFGKIIGKGMEFLKKMQEKNLEENGQPIISMHITDCGVVDGMDEVPPPMLLQDFISQVRFDIMPFLRRNPDKPKEWVGGKSAFAEHLKQRIAESSQKFDEIKQEGDEIVEGYQDEDDDLII